MKRTCKGCKALSYLKCLLDFENEVINGIEIKPGEQCPKPKSTRELEWRLGQKQLIKKSMEIGKVLWR